MLTYYVTSNDGTGGDGSSGSPWQSLDVARTYFNSASDPGDDVTILCTQGTDSVDSLSGNWSPTFSRDVTIKAASGYEASKDGWDSSAYTLARITFSSAVANLENIQISNTSAWAYGVSYAYVGSAISGSVTGCRFEAVANGGGLYVDDTDFTITVENSIFECPLRGIKNNGTLNVYHSVITGGTDGIQNTTGATATVTNCAIFNNTDDIDNAGTITVSYCATDDGDGTSSVSPSGSGSDWDNEFEDETTGDYTLLNTGNCHEGGTSITGNSSTDIDGDDWASSPSIGADEYVASATNYTLECDGGSFTLTGSDAALLYGEAKTITAEGGSFTLTGLAATMTRTYIIDAEGGSFTLTGSAVGFGDYTIIDHESVALFDIIPQDYIDEVQKKLLILPGESHGLAIGYGLDLVETENSRFVSRVNWSGTAETYREDGLRYNRYYLDNSTWNGSCGEEDFWSNSAARSDTLTGLQSIDSSYSGDIYFTYAWCWDMNWRNGLTSTKDSVYKCGWAGASVDGPDGDLAWGLDSGDESITNNEVCMDTYLAAIENYRTNAPGITTYFATGPVDTYHDSEQSYQRHIKHEYIRDYVKSNGGLLFDWADILSWDYDNDQNPGDESWTDGDSTEHTWQGQNDTISAGEYNPDGRGTCHITSDGCLYLAKALWVMLAVDAGWDGTATLDAESGTFTLTGQDATLTYRANTSISAEAGAYTLSGADAGLYKGYAIDADLGTLVFTGSDATLTYTEAGGITADPGTFVTTGIDADLLKAWKLTVEAGSFIQAGTDASLNYGLAMNAEAGGFVATGSDAEFIRTWLLSADAGAIAYTGSSATLTYDGGTTVDVYMAMQITGKSGTIAITGKSGTVTRT